MATAESPSGSSHDLPALHAQIDVLTDLSKRLRTLRQLPPLLLRPDPAASAELGVLSLAEALRHVQGELAAVRASVLEDKAQRALKAALESERADRTGVRASLRRESRKRRRSLTPESPKPYPVFQAKAPSLFPVPHPETPPLALGELAAYIREFNATHAPKALLNVWLPSPTSPRALSVPVILRLSIPDVFMAYITLGHAVGEGNALPPGRKPLIVENVTAFGSREKKLPHSQSEYNVFQKLSQHVLRMLQSAPRVPIQTLMQMLACYQSLFSGQCTICQRVLSVDGHIPPVARVWQEREMDDGAWEPRHVNCMQS
ncbi:hypothetical protein FA95DRAFT_1512746 [Auriscalpium vulgare]|uniref:Uncharacterized protein n=1 Tax=Auriscalpium vulgare TaxID=40419 RepID=A0ACB8S5S7_9AGAM|nr:hypothetical protein FA95DRAFT_1512746 [Auriscalpium vulgare]